MNPAYSPRDVWIARSISAALHLALLGLVGRAMLLAPPPHNVIFSVETVSGLTPRGEGSGAQGTNSQMSDKPANLNPLAGGLRLSVTDAPIPAPKPQAKPAPKNAARKAAAAPSLGDVAKKYEALPIGVSPREGRSGQEPSEGGMGNAHNAGTEDGALGVEGAIAGRGYTPPDFSFGKALPEESEVQLLLTVNAKGDVVEARVKKTSGYPELDQHALAKAREIHFDALPSIGPQDDKTGTVIVRFEYSGKAK